MAFRCPFINTKGQYPERVRATPSRAISVPWRGRRGPNLTYTGSLATLLWRRALREYDADVALGEFTRLGVATVVPALLLCVICLWLSLRV
jgi:arsenical pump membrane protein